MYNRAHKVRKLLWELFVFENMIPHKSHTFLLKLMECLLSPINREESQLVVLLKWKEMQFCVKDHYFFKGKKVYIKQYWKVYIHFKNFETTYSLFKEILRAFSANNFDFILFNQIFR